MEIAGIAEGMTNKALKSMLDSAKDFDSKVKDEGTSVFDSLAKGAVLDAVQLKEEDSMNEFDTFMKNVGLLSGGLNGYLIHLLKGEGAGDDLSVKDYVGFISGGLIGGTIRLLKE